MYLEMWEFFSLGIILVVLGGIIGWSLATGRARKQHETGQESLWPKVGEVFSLTINPGDGETDPKILVRHTYGCPCSDKWIFDGVHITVAGPLTRQFRLVEIGHQEHFATVQEKLREMGKIPEGVWRTPFEAKFGRHSSGKLLGVADASWIAPDEERYFPFIRGDGKRGFESVYRQYYMNTWVWLVEV